MRLPLIFLIHLFMCAQISAQADRILNGIVLDHETGQPVSGANVVVINGDNTRTEEFGRFKLDLYQQNAPGTVLELLIKHPDYGSSLIEYVVKKGLPILKIKIEKTTKIIITGTIRSRQDNKFLEGIEVEAASIYLNQAVEPPTVSTDKFGRFIMHLDRRDFNRQNIEYLDILIKDPRNMYKDDRITINVYAVLDILLENGPSPIRQLAVNDYRKEYIDVNAGDLVVIEASGNIRVGEWVGTLGPEGRATGLFNVSLGIYSIYREYNHGALLIRTESTEDWKLCGKSYQYRAQRKGRLMLEFDINDNNKRDNEGFFNVSIRVQ